MSIAITGKMLAFSRLHLNTNDSEAIEHFIANLKLNTITPVLLDSSVVQDLQALIDLLWRHGIAVIGVVQGVLDEMATAQRLAIFPNDGKRIARLEHTAQPISDTKDSDPIMVADTPQKDTPQHTTLNAQKQADLVYTQLVRSGQVIHHLGGDIILTQGVNHGAEVASDYSLHIYGKAQGRLVAGATGDKSARIFCHGFDPSLVSVAGTYCPKEDIPAHVIGKAVMVSLTDNDQLCFDVID